MLTQNWRRSPPLSLPLPHRPRCPARSPGAQSLGWQGRLWSREGLPRQTYQDEIALTLGVPTGSGHLPASDATGSDGKREKEFSGSLAQTMTTTRAAPGQGVCDASTRVCAWNSVSCCLCQETGCARKQCPPVPSGTGLHRRNEGGWGSLRGRGLPLVLLFRVVSRTKSLPLQRRWRLQLPAQVANVPLSSQTQPSSTHPAATSGWGWHRRWGSRHTGSVFCSGQETQPSPPLHSLGSPCPGLCSAGSEGSAWRPPLTQVGTMTG